MISTHSNHLQGTTSLPGSRHGRGSSAKLFGSTRSQLSRSRCGSWTSLSRLSYAHLIVDILYFVHSLITYKYMSDHVSHVLNTQTHWNGGWFAVQLISCHLCPPQGWVLTACSWRISKMPDAYENKWPRTLRRRICPSKVMRTSARANHGRIPGPQCFFCVIEPCAERTPPRGLAWSQETRLFQCYSNPIPYYSILFHTIPYYSMLFHAIPCYSMLFHAIPCYSMLFHTIPCYSMLFHTSPYYSMLFHAIPYYSMLFHTIPCYSMLFQTIPCYSILFHAIPYYSILFHTIPYYSNSIPILFHTIPCYSILLHTIPYYSILLHTIPYFSILFHTSPY